MQKERMTKTLSMDRGLTKAIEKAAKAENRSFTKQVELMLGKALERRSGTKAKPETASA